MAGKQSREPDDAGRWQPARGVSWPYWIVLKDARRKYQEKAFSNDRSRVREYPKASRASEHVSV